MGWEFGIAAMNRVAGAVIPIQLIATHAMHHDKHILVNGRHIEIGSFNDSQAAARIHAESGRVVWNHTQVARPTWPVRKTVGRKVS